MNASLPSPPELQEKNRRVARILLMIASVLAVAALLAGIRW